ncbi:MULTISPECIES: hypothetical protein [Flavobacterium]|uniref:Carboxypeptidase-like regulatory domain-containing protein n=1 Tax=Flavobacterium hankyongi TaxID=1176532 RepID=A0ABP8ZSW8_9FLAO|nr:hypothetical protein [Flavobacterium sp. N1846]
MKNLLAVFFICIFQSAFSQCELKGKVISDISDVKDIIVFNFTTKNDTLTDSSGLFTIEAKPGDRLIISSPKLEGLEIVLNENSFRMNPLIVEVKSKANELAEIKISRITAKSLGIIGKNVKEYTVAERRLRTATTGGPVGMIYNLFSGQKDMLKKIVEVEKYELNHEKLLRILTEDFFLTTLKIAKENLNGFLIFASEDSTITKLLKDKNYGNLKFKLVELAFKFKELKNEN